MGAVLIPARRRPARGAGARSCLPDRILCQSAAEKFLKGYLISRGWSLEKTHDIPKLLKMCEVYGKELGGLATEGVILNEYVVAGRYPGDIGIEAIGALEATEALAATQRVRARVLALMSRSGGSEQ